MTELEEARAKALLESHGYTVIKTKSYQRSLEMRRRAEALLACQEEHNEHTRHWAGLAFDEQRRLSDRLNYVYGVARAHGLTHEELAGGTE